jgi:hypothetical protein
MNFNFKLAVFFITNLFLSVALLRAQVSDRIYKPYIRTAQLYVYGNQQSLPIIALNSNTKLELEFDDMDGNYKNYYYTYVLCDYNWQPSKLSAFDFIKGFTQSRINTYRYSNIAYKKYTHYQAFLPDQNSMPSRSGNYLLKVYLDGDTSKLVFTKPFLVFEQKANITATVVQPFTPEKFYTHQRVRFSAT